MFGCRDSWKPAIQTSWKKTGHWKNRYSTLYGKNLLTVPKADEDDPSRRISFMTNESTPYTALLMRVRENRRDSASSSPSPRYLTSMLSQQGDLYGTYTGTGNMLSEDQSSYRKSVELGSLWSDIMGRRVSDDLGGHETLLLDMVRAKSRELQEEAQDQPLELPKDDNVSDDQSSEPCFHGLAMRMTERSISRSRVSRVSTRRDMDIPSILAFTTTTTNAPVPLEIPGFKKLGTPETEAIPRWSVRRAVCPVCSQKWRDKSSISNIKNSGLKRNSSSELPSVIAPGRLRAACTMGYIPQPVVATVDQEAGIALSGLRNASATWHITRARRFRAPKPQLPPPEATAPLSSTAPLAQRDLDNRVSKFLHDIEVKLTA